MVLLPRQDRSRLHMRHPGQRPHPIHHLRTPARGLVRVCAAVPEDVLPVPLRGPLTSSSRRIFLDGEELLGGVWPYFLNYGWSSRSSQASPSRLSPGRAHVATAPRCCWGQNVNGEPIPDSPRGIPLFGDGFGAKSLPTGS
jgi:hypothetical protein